MPNIAKLLPLLVGALLMPTTSAYPQTDNNWAARPDFVRGIITRTHYDGVSNDLLTAGLGKSGLADGSHPPVPNDSKNPTAEELRKLAIFSNYRAIVDTSPGGGYGVFFGPNVGADGQASGAEGLIAGDEFIAFADDGSGRQNVTMLVQVPDGFDPANACIVAAPSSGSRGVYGAIATGEWGLKQNCAVAYVDKGSGTGVHDLARNTVNLIRGERADAALAGTGSNFTAALDDRQRAAFNAERPHRFAFKHAHSQRNPEKDWGRNVLQSIEFAFYVLNRKFGASAGAGRGITKRNTIVIASSISNGGGASLRAAEQDRAGLIDAVVVAEPNVNPRFDPRFTIIQDGRAPFREHSRSLFDYVTFLNVFQACANVDLVAPVNSAPSPERCEALHAKGLLAATTPAAQAAEAQHLVNDYGILLEQNAVQPSHWSFYVPQSIAVTYANAYGRFSVVDDLCRYSFAATGDGGIPVALAEGTEAMLFATGGGLPPTAPIGGVNLINDGAPGGSREDRISTPEQNLEGALCLRGLATGRDPVTGRMLEGRARADHDRIARGIQEIRADGNLRGRPAIIVTGRNDAILALNHTSRAYFGLNKLVEGGGSGLRYIEVTNAHHLDAFNGLFADFKPLYIPLHRYYVQAMDLMLDHLKRGTPLPTSQLVRTTPRGKASDGTVPALSATSVPPILPNPPADAVITFTSGEVRIPN
jgi:hydroxybutyrate-dimer hydrolase